MHHLNIIIKNALCLNIVIKKQTISTFVILRVRHWVRSIFWTALLSTLICTLCSFSTVRTNRKLDFTCLIDRCP